MIKRSLHEQWGVLAKDGLLTQCVRRFGLPKETKEASRDVFADFHVTAARFNDLDPKEVVVSYSGGPVALFDINSEAASFGFPSSTRKRKRSAAKENLDDKVDAEEHRPLATEERGHPSNSSADVPPHRPSAQISQPAKDVAEATRESESESEVMEIDSSVIQEVLDAANEGDESSASDEELLSDEPEEAAMSEDDEAESGWPGRITSLREQRRLEDAVNFDVPALVPAKTYVGHVNSDTVRRNDPKSRSR